MFESSDPNERVVNKTDSRFFWMALYVQPVCWVGLAVVAVTHPMWLSLVGECFSWGVWRGWRKEKRGGGVALCVCRLGLMGVDSYCVGAHDHEYAGVFAV